MTVTPPADERNREFRRNPQLEALLDDVNSALAGAEQALLPAHPPRWPLIFVVGALRSGTTLMMQWLANTGLAAVPTNLLSRFYRAPVLGAKIQLLLTDPRYRFRDELAGLATAVDYDSSNGKTRGALSPNEFWYFWRRFLPDDATACLPPDQLAAQVDSRHLVAELAGLTEVFQSPFAMKAMLLNYNLGYLDRLFDKAVFLHVHREPVANMASILAARQRQFGSDAPWYSFRIPEYDTLKDLPPAGQAAGQVFSINRAIGAGLAEIPPHKQLTVAYEDFCAAPAATYRELAALLRRHGMDIKADYAGPAHFTPSRPPAAAAELRRVWESIVARPPPAGSAAQGPTNAE